MSSYLENLPSITGNLGDSIVIFNEYVLKSARIDGGTRLTISRDNEVQTIDIMDGYTPQKGIDYWTDDDKAEFRDEASNAALTAISVDTSLSESGKPADAAAVGSVVSNLSQAVKSLTENGTGIPAVSTPSKQLVTDCDGNPGWEERTHYAYTTVSDLLPECSMTLVEESAGLIMQDFDGTPIPNETYAVEWNGIVYSCKAIDFEMDGIRSIYFGNGAPLGLEAAEAPFMILMVPEAYRDQLEGASAIVYILDGSTEATLKINGKVEIVKPLDPKYLSGMRCQNLILLSTNGEHLSKGVALTPSVPFAAAWEMDDAELQTAIRIVEERDTSANYCAVYGVTRFQSDHWMNTIQMSCTLFNDVNQGFELVIQWYDDGNMGNCSVTNRYGLLPDVSQNSESYYLKSSGTTWSTQTIDFLREDIGIDAQAVGAANAGKLLYVGSEGLLVPLTLGDGLEIVDGVLKLSASDSSD